MNNPATVAFTAASRLFQAGLKVVGSLPGHPPTYLPLDLPHVQEVLAQLGGQEVLSAKEGESPSRTVPSPV